MPSAEDIVSHFNAEFAKAPKPAPNATYTKSYSDLVNWQIDETLTVVVIPMIAKLHEQIGKLTAQVDTLTAQVAELTSSSSPPQSGTALFSQVVLKGSRLKSLTPPESHMLNVIAAEQLEVTKRARNIIIVGLPVTDIVDKAARDDADRKAVTSLVNILKISDTITSYDSVSRITTKAPNGATTTMLRVQLDSQSDWDRRKSAFLSASHDLRHVNGMESVYIRPDRTAAQQALFRALSAQKRAANEALGDQLDKPLRWVVRENCIRRIDVVKSSAAKKSIYDDPSSS